MRTAFISLAVEIGWSFAIESFRDKVSLAQLQLWAIQFKEGGY